MKNYEIKPLKPKKGSAYKYRLFVDGLAKTCYETERDAFDHVAVLKGMEEERQRIAREQSFYDKWQSIYDNDEQDLH